MQGNSRIDFANTLRGFAAIAVMISHYFGFFGLGREQISGIINAPALSIESHAVPSYTQWLFATPIFSLAAFGVALFFLISGFVIPFTLQKTNWTGFCVNRVLRIAPTYIVGFTLTLLALHASTAYFSTTWPYTLREVLIHYIPGIRDIMWSRHIDFIVWTLEIEMKFYLVCAILILWFRQQSLKVFFAPVILFAFAIYLNRMIPVWGSENASAWRLATVYMGFSKYIIYMFIGVMFHYLYRGKIDANKAYLGIGGLFAIFCIHWWAGPYSANLRVAWSYAFALLTFAFAYSFPGFFKSNRLFDFLADISYPLYVIHGVAGFVALRIMLDMGFKAWASLLIVTIACLFLSWLLHILVESPSQKLGKQLAAKLTGRRLNTPALQQGA